MQTREDGFYLYRFLDERNKILYVGKTNNMRKRMSGHKSKSVHIGEHDGHREMYERIHKVEFCILENEYQMDIYEIHFISLFQPKFNTTFKYKGAEYMDIRIEWNTYIFDILVRRNSGLFHTDTGIPYTMDERYRKINEDNGYHEYTKMSQEYGEFVPLYFEGCFSGLDDPTWMFFEDNLIMSNFDKIIEGEFSGR